MFATMAMSSGTPPPSDPLAPPGSKVTAPATAASETSPPSQASYSAKLQLNVNRNERLKRNVLEINLETDDKTFVKIEGESVARLLTRIGINYNTQAEAIQTCP